MTQATAVIHINLSNMYGEPSVNSKCVSQAIFGETVTVVDLGGDFAHIRTPDGYLGWVRREHIWLQETGEKYPDPKYAALTTPLHLPLFHDPNSRSERITLLTIGTVVEVVPGSSRDGFVGIRLPSNGLAFAEETSLIIPDYPTDERLGPNAALIARGLTGIPYLQGGRTTFGFDCSGFVQRVVWLCGRILPRDAHQQAVFSGCVPVERNAIKPGDLIFFTDTSDPQNRGITHVGLALGDNRFVHACREMGTSITSLDDPKYAQEFHSATRFGVHI